RQIGHALRPDEHRRERLYRGLPGHFVHAPEAREGEENRAIVRAPDWAKYPNHGERVLGHLLSLVEAIADTQPGPPGRLGSQQSLVGGAARRIVGKPSPGREGERLAPPGKRGEVCAVRGYVAKALKRIAQRYGYCYLDARIILERLVRRGKDVRGRGVHA